MRDEEKFHAERRTGIGGSDAPVILGLSPYMTPLQLWAVKTGAIEGSLNYDRLVGASEQRDMGRRLQPLIIEVFRERTRRDVQNISDDLLVRHRTEPWLIGHLDAWQWIDGDTYPLEVKNVIVYKRELWQDHAPIEALVQLQHYLMVTGKDQGSIASLIAGFEFRYEDVVANQSFLDGLWEREQRFWVKHVQADVPPEPTARDNKFLNTLVPAAPKTYVQLPAEWVTVDEEYLGVCKAIEEARLVLEPLEEKKDELEARIKLAMGEHEQAEIDGGGTWTFKQIDRKGYSVKPSSYRRLVRKGSQNHG